MKFSVLVISCLVSILINGCSEPIEADLIVHNATIHSVNDQMDTEILGAFN